MSQQQTVLRVKTNIPSATISGATEFQNLDLYDDIPIKINKSFAELQDISKKNSDYSIGLSLPSSKANNRFFESYFNVEAQSLYFNSQKRVECSVLVDSEPYFSGYMRLNKINVINSSAEYDVTLYSEIGNLFGEIGNKLLKDLDFDDPEYTFNHTFSLSGVTALLQRSNFYRNAEKPYPYFYPIIHNGYNYESISGLTLPNVSGTTTGATLIDQTRLYTSTGPISGFTDYTGATAAGVQEYYINSPEFPLRDNQLKPALSIWSLLKLMFKEYGYTISGDFFNTPWAKSLYLYGYFSSELTKFSYKLNTIQQLPKEGVELIYSGSTAPNSPLNIIVCKRGTGIPCYCLDNVNYGFANMFPYSEFGVINAGTSGKTVNAVEGFDFGFEVDGVPVADISTLKYAPKAVGTSVAFIDGDEIDFSLVIDPAIKQIDLLGSIAKKFNLVFIPNPDNVHDIIVEPYDFYVGTGTIKDWTPKLSWDKGFSVEPALNFVESTLILSDLEDGDEANRIFKNVNNRVYGWNKVDNPTDFKSEEKKIETIFSPEIIRKWDNNIGLPLGINYSASSEISTYDNQIRWFYKGVKTKPKLFFWLMGQNPFIDSVGEVFPQRSINTYTIGIQSSLLTGFSYTNRYNLIPTISHTMPIGLNDEYKLNNDSLSILFNSEEPTDTIGVQSYNVYTENDAYSVFYKNRITNIYDQNTRFVRGFFNLNYSDIQNLKPNDIIKINEQHFVLNKVEGFNLTSRELTSVELIQFNVNPQTYTDRYFKLTYCDAPQYSFQFKTDFTNPNLQDTNYVWSVYYDNQVGSLVSSTTGFTSTFRVFDISSPTPLVYVPYTMQEITKEEYDIGQYYYWEYDTLRNYIYTNPDLSGDGPLYSMSTFWESGDEISGFTGVNVWENCTDFYNTASTYGIITGSSTYYGTIPFAAKINTAAVGDNYVVSLPYGAGGTYSGIIDWGDGSTSVNSYANRSHTYVTAGQYTIVIKGQITQFSTGIYSNTFRNVVTSIEQFGQTFNFTNAGRYFEECRLLTKVGYDISLSGITELGRTFYNSPLFNQNINHWNVSGITGMFGVFFRASSFNQPLNSWNTANVTDMSYMFYFAVRFNQDINSWNVGNVTNMNNMFSNASAFNQPLNSWNVGKVTLMNDMFWLASSFNQPLNSWNVSKVTNMFNMFNDSQFNQPLNSWVVTGVTTMGTMFANTPFNQDISSWNMSGVTNISVMFAGRSKFNQNINSWNVGNVTRMDGMFFENTVFNQPLNSWNTGNVLLMANMFAGATSFNQDISSWNTRKVTNMSSMFNGATSFNQPLNSWIVSGATTMSAMFSNAVAFNQNLNSWNTANVTSMSNMFRNATSFNGNISSWNTAKVTSMLGMFNGATSFNQNIGNLNVSGVTTMNAMFSGATSFTTANLDNIYNGFSALPSLRNNVLFTAPPCYTAVAGRGILTGTYNWRITDGGLCP